jgi:predicted nucleic acid-binding Zn ribbon protein
MHKKQRLCIVCASRFYTTHPNYITCSKKCSSINKVNRRYIRENNNWEAYFKHLLSKKQGANLTVEQLVNMLNKQKHGCALTGIPLTCIRKRGTIIQTNASIDRINAGMEYNINNIQLVCRAINSFRGNMEVDEFILWCNEVTEHALRKQTQTLQKRIRAAKNSR